MNILTINLLANTVIFWIAARMYHFPRLSGLSPQVVLGPILLLHATRHLGLMFLHQGAVYPGMPLPFAYPAAVGDFNAAILALACLLALTRRWAMTAALLWIFSIEGFVDLMNAILLSTLYEADRFMGLRTGYLLFGSRRCWSRTQLCSFYCGERDRASFSD